jgi:AraC-like DNA-binding protein
MQLLRPSELKSGFWAIQAQRLIPELIDFGQAWVFPGFELNPHFHRYWEFFFQVDGETEWACMGQAPVKFKSGSIYCVGPNINHWMLRSVGFHRYLIVSLDLGLVQNRIPELRDIAVEGFQIVHGVPHLENYFAEVLKEATTTQKYREVGLRLALDALVVNVLRALRSPDLTSPDLPTHPAVARAKQLLSHRFREPWTLELLAQEVGVSRARLAALFSAETGSTIHRTLVKRRIAAAEELLRRSDLTIEEIANACGFQTGKHFAQLFHSQNGCTPRKFRAQSHS